jgi:hypothetical protein
MAEDVVKIPVLNLEIPKPKPWDLAALAAVVAGLAAAIANLTTSGMTQPGSFVSTPLTVVFVLVQLVVCLGSLMLLGKTATEGTIHGNLLSIGGMLIGLTGVMLAAAIWAAA